MTPEELLRAVDAAFDEIVMHQQCKVLDVARQILPYVTFEDISNPQDYPQLIADGTFNYEEGMLAGLMAARVALKRRIFAPLVDGREIERALSITEVEAAWIRKSRRADEPTSG